MTRIAILDPKSHIVGLKLIFPEADYYAYYTNNDGFDSCIKNADIFYKQYNFNFKTDWSQITDKNYDIFIMVSAYYDVHKMHNPYLQHKQIVYDVIENGLNIINNNTFKKTILIDNHDYDYDPSLLRPDYKFDLYYKRYYNKSKLYSQNVYPFPIIGFGFPCPLWELLSRDNNTIVSKTEDSIFWAGSLFEHNDPYYKIYRNRYNYFNEISDLVKTINNRFSFEEFKNTLLKHKFILDLPGVGDPNRRYLEGLGYNNLIFLHKDATNIKYPFEGLPLNETTYENREDFINKYNRLSNDKDFYNMTINKQKELINKYINTEWLRNYILR
jgi:hypothetical protein